MEAAACLECGAGLFSEAGSDSDTADCRSCPDGQYLVQAASGARICQDSLPWSGALPSSALVTRWRRSIDAQITVRTARADSISTLLDSTVS